MNRVFPLENSFRGSGRSWLWFEASQDDGPQSIGCILIRIDMELQNHVRKVASIIDSLYDGN